MSYFNLCDRSAQTEEVIASAKEPTLFGWQNRTQDPAIGSGQDVKPNLLAIIAEQFKPLPPIAVMRFEAGCFGD